MENICAVWKKCWLTKCFRIYLSPLKNIYAYICIILHVGIKYSRTCFVVNPPPFFLAPLCHIISSHSRSISGSVYTQVYFILDFCLHSIEWYIDTYTYAHVGFFQYCSIKIGSSIFWLFSLGV